MWMIASLFSLVLPVFLPSYTDANNLTGNPISVAMVIMFVLSFPSSLFGLPLLIVANSVLDIDSNSIQGMYLDLVLLFVLGFVQWFWIAPRIWRDDPETQIADLRLHQSPVPLPASRMPADFEFFASDDQTPLEKVLNGDESK